ALPIFQRDPQPTLDIVAERRPQHRKPRPPIPAIRLYRSPAYPPPPPGRKGGGEGPPPPAFQAAPPSPPPPPVIPSGAPVTNAERGMIRLLLILLLAVLACDPSARGADSAGVGEDADSLAARPPAAYERRMLFLAGPGARPV